MRVCVSLGERIQVESNGPERSGKKHKYYRSFDCGNGKSFRITKLKIVLALASLVIAESLSQLRKLSRLNLFVEHDNVENFKDLQLQTLGKSLDTFQQQFQKMA